MQKRVGSYIVCFTALVLSAVLGLPSPAMDEQTPALPEYNEVVFVSWGDGGWDIYRLHGSEITRLTDDPGST